jgi:hypothetical protein
LTQLQGEIAQLAVQAGESPTGISARISCVSNKIVANIHGGRMAGQLPDLTGKLSGRKNFQSRHWKSVTRLKTPIFRTAYCWELRPHGDLLIQNRFVKGYHSDDAKASPGWRFAQNESEGLGMTPEAADSRVNCRGFR